MDDLLVECPIHLDGVSIKDILVFRCGHGFCEPCLEEHFAHQVHSGRLSCPTCRNPVKRREAFSLFLTPAHSFTQTSLSAGDAHARLMKELREAKAAHAHSSGRVTELEREVDNLRQDGARHEHTIHHLRGRYEVLEERHTNDAYNSARVKEERNRLKEEVTRLQVENQKTSMALEEALKETQVQLERVKQFQGYTREYKHKYNLEKKKRKAIEDTNSPQLPRKEEESLMVVDANAPDTLHQDRPDFRWLDEACRVKGDQLAMSDDQEMETEKESEDDEIQLKSSDSVIKGKQREEQTPKPALQFFSDWNLGLGAPFEHRRKNKQGSKLAGARKVVKLKVPQGGSHKGAGGPLAIDRQGRVKGAVVLGSRQRLNSKN